MMVYPVDTSPHSRWVDPSSEDHSPQQLRESSERVTAAVFTIALSLFCVCVCVCVCVRVWVWVCGCTCVHGGGGGGGGGEVKQRANELQKL